MRTRFACFWGAMGIAASASLSFAQPALTGSPTLAASPSAASELTHVYRLTPAASFTEGCFDPCACPIWMTEDFRGTMRVEPLAVGSVAFDYYRITEVNWLVGADGGQFRMTGEGTYRTGLAHGSRVQQLTLDLKRGEDGAIEHFDSGLVPGGSGGAYPAINVAINKNGLYCFDTLIQVSAAPVPRRQLRPYTLTRESWYQEGCLPPCLCPILQDMQTVGRFDLVRIHQLGDVTEYAVVNVDWRNLSNFSPDDVAGTQVRGFGIYRAQNLMISPLPVLPNHEMFLDLVVGDEPDFFESGWVPNANGPSITIAMATNGFFCYDEVFSIDAQAGN